ncbi:hypothetical protein RvY_07341 [Ramazzottius varieornatus]|uniref:Uncharacterized protein n=1 Tax=Ramazzottius varieornatus TaxID=947166 RepID=A0A1D1V1T5_RAMVA|nr:hypothetical protein RvY_07341 [Ramazzottius varieornatus]
MGLGFDGRLHFQGDIHFAMLSVCKKKDQNLSSPSPSRELYYSLADPNNLLPYQFLRACRTRREKAESSTPVEDPHRRK